MSPAAVAPSPEPDKDEETGEELMLSHPAICVPCHPFAHPADTTASCVKVAVTADHGWLLLGYSLMWASFTFAIWILLDLRKISKGWLASGILLLLVQQCFATLQLLRAEFNISGGVQPLFGTYVRSIFWPWKSITRSPIPTDMVAFRWTIYFILAATYIVFLADNMVITVVLFSPFIAGLMSKEEKEHSIRWAGQYGHRRLGIAAMLMAAPTAIFHLYILLKTRYLRPLAQSGQAVEGIPPHSPQEWMLLTSIAVNVSMLVCCWRGVASAIHAVLDCSRRCAVGNSMRNVLQYALMFGDIVMDVFFAMAVWKDHRPYLFPLAVAFIGLQYYASMLGMLWFTWDGTPLGFHIIPTTIGALLSPLIISGLDLIAAAPLVIAPFVRTADQDTWASWLSLIVVTVTVPLLFIVEGLLRAMRGICSLMFPHHPTLMPVIPPCECGTVSVFEDDYIHWAENFKFARMHVQAFLESFFQGALQFVVFVHYLSECAGDSRASGTCQDYYHPKLGLVIASITLSVVNTIKGVVGLRRAAAAVGLTIPQEICLMLGLKAGPQLLQPASELFVHGDQFLDMRDVAHLTHAQQASALRDGIIFRARGTSEGSSVLSTIMSTISSCLRRWELVIVNLDDAAGDIDSGARCTVQPRVMLGNALLGAKSHLRELEGVHLEGCYFGHGYLEELGTSIKALQHQGVPLISLRLSSCNGLTDLTPRQGLALSPLRVLHLHCCSSLLSVPAILHMPDLIELELFQCCELKLLPDGDYSKMKSLKVLHLQECDSLTQIPEGMLKLPSLEEFQVDNCDLITELPGNDIKDFQQMKSLRVVEIWGCMSLSQLPEGLLQLKAMRKIEAQGDRHDLWKL